MHIQQNIDLLPYNTFHFSCIAKRFVIVKSKEDFLELINHDVYKSTPKKLFLGGGSNMLFASDFYDGLIIKNEIMGITLESMDEQKVIVNVGSGEGRNEFVQRTVEQGRAGIENLISIPGTVGAAPVQNIGAYGVEAKDAIISVTGVNCLTGEEITLSHDECQFGYRTSIFKETLNNTFYITEVQFALEKIDNNVYKGNVNYEGVAEKVDHLDRTDLQNSRLTHIAQAIAEIRASKLPDLSKIGTAGSFFQNPIISPSRFEEIKESFPELKGWPVEIKSGNSAPSEHIKLSAGQLIEIAGFKGHTENNVGVYEHHALVLVHHGNSSGSYLLEIIQKIQQKVETLFSVQLIPEVQIIH